MAKYLMASLVMAFVVGTIAAGAIRKGMHSFAFAWITNMVLMLGAFYVTENFHLRLQASYYNAKKWEDDGHIYRWFGVNIFRKLMVWTGWEKVTKAANPVKKGIEALKHLEYGTRKSEFGHLAIFLIMLVLTLFVGFSGGLKQVRWLLLLNVVFNAYPILVQRYNRPRLQRAISKFSGRAAGVRAS